MTYLLDTNVLSEPMKHAPNPAVLAWLANIGDDFAISAVSIEELYYGALRMTEGKRKQSALIAVETVAAEHADKVLPFTAEDAKTCARLRALAWSSGNNIAYQDLAICATALRAGRTVATRNVKDFAPLGIETYNPFT